MEKEEKLIQVKVKLKAYVGDRRVYPDQIISIPESQFSEVLFDKVDEVTEGEVKSKKEVEKESKKDEAKKVNKEVI